MGENVVQLFLTRHLAKLKMNYILWFVPLLTSIYDMYIPIYCILISGMIKILPIHNGFNCFNL